MSKNNILWKSSFKHIYALRNHWPECLMEAGEIALYMFLLLKRCHMRESRPGASIYKLQDFFCDRKCLSDVSLGAHSESSC